MTKPSPTTPPSPRRTTYTLGNLIFAVTLIAIFFGLRSSYVLGPREGSAIARAFHVPPIIAAVASAYCCSQVRLGSHRRQRLIWHSTNAGCTAAALSALVLGWEITRSLQSDYYWDRARDFPYFALVIGGEFIFGGLVGAVIGSLWSVASHRTSQADDVS